MMKLRRFSALVGVTLISSGTIACGNTRTSDDDWGGAPSSGGAATGGGRPSSGGLGGDVVINVGSGGAGTGGGSSGGTGTGGSAPEGWLAICEIDGKPTVGDPDGTLSIDSFDDGQPGFSGNGLWGGHYAYTDGTGQQIPTGNDIDTEVESGGVPESGFALHVQGSGQTAWGSGFGAIFASLGIEDECLFDASAYSGVSFWAKGNITPDGLGMGARPGRLRVKVAEKDVVPFMAGGNCPDGAQCYDSRGKNIELTECWSLYSISFSELVPEGWGFSGGPLDLNELYTLEFGIGDFSTYDIWIDDLRFFVGEAPTGEPICDNGMGGMGGMLSGTPAP